MSGSNEMRKQYVLLSVQDVKAALSGTHINRMNDLIRKVNNYRKSKLGKGSY